MSKQPKGGRLPLEEPLAGDLCDFCAANFEASERAIIRAALRAFIDDRLEKEPELRKRFHAAREARIGVTKKITVLQGGKEKP